MGAKQKAEPTAEMFRAKVISNWSAVFGAPEVVVAAKGSRFIGGFPQEFRTDRNIVSQTVIPGHHQSLGATERRRGHFRLIVDHMIGNKKPNSSGREEWMEFAAMATMRLNSQVRQFGGFTPWKVIFGRAPKMPIGPVGNPHFEDFTNPAEASTTKTHHLIGIIQKIRQASLSAYFSGKLNSELRKRIRESGNGAFFSGQTFFSSLSTNREAKGERRRLGSW